MPSESLSKGWRRDANIEKIGYFRTDDASVAAIASLIKPQSSDDDDQSIQLFDPCAGEGLACEALAQQWSNTETWGVELDETRFRDASTRLNHCLNADALSDTHLSQSWASVMLFNPPYGDVQVEGRHGKKKTERLEAQFWSRHATRLARGGVMVAILPTQLFSRAPGIIRAMSYFFAGETVQVFRGDDKFNQIVIVGYRRRDREAPQNTALVDCLNAIVDQTWMPDPITAAPPGQFVIRPGRTPDLFESLVLTSAMAEVARAQAGPEILDEIEKDLVAQTQSIQNPTITPLRQGHIPHFLAAGRLDGHVYDNGQHLLVKGSVQRVAQASSNIQELESDSSSTKKTTHNKIFKWQTLILAWDLTPDSGVPLIKVQ